MIERNKKIYIFILLLMITMLSGCWDYQEMTEYADVTAVAIDKGEEKQYKITVEGKKYSPSLDIDAEPVLIDSEGDTILEAIRHLIKSSGKRIHIGSIQIIIVSEEIAKEGLHIVTDVFYRSNRSRLLTRLYVAKGTTAGSLLEETAVYSLFAGYEIAEISEQIDVTLGLVAENQLYEITDKILDKYKNPKLLVLELVDLPNDKKTFEVSGMGCFKGDKLIGYIEHDMIFIYAIIINKFKSVIKSIPYEDKGLIAIDVYKLSSKRSFKMINNQLNMYLNIKMEIGYLENGTELIDIESITAEGIKQVTTLFYKDKINEFHQFVKDNLKHDVLEFEEYYRKKNYRQWKKTDENFDYVNDTVIHTEIKIILRGAGHLRLK